MWSLSLIPVHMLVARSLRRCFGVACQERIQCTLNGIEIYLQSPSLTAWYKKYCNRTAKNDNTFR